MPNATPNIAHTKGTTHVVDNAPRTGLSVGKARLTRHLLNYILIAFTHTINSTQPSLPQPQKKKIGCASFPSSPRRFPSSSLFHRQRCAGLRRWRERMSHDLMTSQ
jgi:hypothetical protein